MVGGLIEDEELGGFLKAWGLGSLRCEPLGVEGVDGSIRTLDVSGVEGCWLTSAEVGGTVHGALLESGTGQQLPSSSSADTGVGA